MGFNKNTRYLDKDWVNSQMQKEMGEGLDLLNSIKEPIITFFGGHKVEQDDIRYQHAKSVAKTLAEQGYAVMSGGGPGIMQAANSGATQASGRSIGAKMALLKGEAMNKEIFTDMLFFDFFSVRRYILSIKSVAYVFYPGGFGTLNELFEYVTLIQTGVTDKVPVILVGKDYWRELIDWLKKNMQKDGLLITDHDIDLLHVVDSEEEIVNLIKARK